MAAVHDETFCNFETTRRHQCRRLAKIDGLCTFHHNRTKAKPQPEAVKPQPEAVKPQPEAVKPQPEAVKPQPEAVKITPPAKLTSSSLAWTVLEPFISEEDRSQKSEIDKLRRLNRQEQNDILSILFDQPAFEVVEPVFELYALDLANENAVPRKITDIYTMPDQGNHITIQASDSQLLLHIYSPVSLVQYLRLLSNSPEQNRRGRRYAFIPAGLSMEGKGADHQVMLCIDLESDMSYLLDPNGETGYFDRMFGFSVEPVIEKLLGYYFSRMAEVGRPIFFESRRFWNDQRLSVNRNLAGTSFAGGNCVVISFIVSHYLSLTAANPIEAYVELNKEPEAGLIHLINGYIKLLHLACCKN